LCGPPGKRFFPGDDGIKAAIARYYLSTGAGADVAERLARRFSGHSGRVGFVVAAKEAGAADSDIAQPRGTSRCR
jgi:hypothetical protein